MLMTEYELSEMQKTILRLYGHRRRSGKVELLSSEEVAAQVPLDKDGVNDELEKMEFLGLLDVGKAFGGSYSAKITPAGLLVLDEIGPISDK